MNFKITQEDKHTLISSQVDKLDATNAPELKSELVFLSKNGVNTIVLDLSKTRYCDSSGLSAILAANRICKDTNGKFVLSGLQDNVSKMIGIAQLDKVLAIVNTSAEAQEFLSK